jgi:Cu/Zn superoxide dismutase
MYTEQMRTYNKKPNIIEAIATINEHNISGVIRFGQYSQSTGNGATIVTGEINGLDKGVYQIYIHEFGDLSNGCQSTGKCYNPFRTDSNMIDNLSNIATITANNNKFYVVVPTINLSGHYSIIGRAVVIHRNPDHDNFGHGCHYDPLTKSCSKTRIASGVIGLTESKR